MVNKIAVVKEITLKINQTSKSCMTNCQQTGNDRENTCEIKPNNTQTLHDDELSTDTGNEGENSCKTNTTDTQTLHDEISIDTFLSIFTLIKAMLFIFLLYECHFDFIFHLAIGSLLLNGILSTVLEFNLH